MHFMKTISLLTTKRTLGLTASEFAYANYFRIAQGTQQQSWKTIRVQNNRNHLQQQNYGNSKNFLFSRNMVSDTDAVTYLEIPDKSENDKKLYKALILCNGMKALLISDPSPVPHDGMTTSSSSSSFGSEENSSPEDARSSSGGSEESVSTSNSDPENSESEESDSDEGDEKLAACAILVDVGSFTEPTKYQGLAHFLEHMIFMGSEKYPTENAFDAHIKKCGGFSNANTECEETLFYFEVSEEHLDLSMDYFSALLKKPLMKEEAMSRERYAVESEFQQIIYDDETRRDQLLAFLATTGYPQATFTWGNLKSLKENVDDRELHKALHDFQREHYSGNRMVVCVQARLPIDELEALVIKHFSTIPSNNSVSPDFSKFDFRTAFREEFFKRVFFVKPVENICKLELTWVFPPVNQLYRCKPDQFLSYLVGYEGDGSLCAYLRKKLWGLELLAGIDDSGFDTNSIYSLFNLCIYLTDDGFKHLDEVLGATFAFIKLFSRCGPLQEAYAELQNIEAIGFRFQSQKPAFDNVQTLAVKTKYYKPKDILTSTDLYYEYNEEQIQNIIAYLNEFKFNIMLTSEQKYEGIEYDQKEHWFGTDYTTIETPEKWAKLWANPPEIQDLYLPKPNRFVSNDFRLFWHENGKPELALAPKKILQTDTGELWFRQDDKFNLPDVFMYFYFVSPLPRQSPKNDVLCTLYAQLIKFHLVEELYPATIAGLTYQFFPSEKGVTLKVNGYNEKLHLIVDIITKAMKTIANDIAPETLDVFIKYQKKSYFNSVIKPKTLNKDIRLSVVEYIRFPMIEKYKCLTDITLDTMRDFARTFTDELYVQALIQGNYTEESAHNVMNSVLSTLNCQHIKETKYIENRTVQLPQGAHYIRCHALNDKDPNTVVCNFYQIGPCTVRMEAMLDLLMMFVEEPLFDNLRTKEQLGYYVDSTVRINYGIAGYSITVNSQETNTTARHVEERIEAFRGKMMEILQEMTDEEFDHVRHSLIKIKMVVDMSLNEEVTRNWDEITSEEYFFDRRRREVEVLRTVTRAEIIDFLVNNERTNLRKLSVQVIGHRPPGMPKPVNKLPPVENAEKDKTTSAAASETSSDSYDFDEMTEEELFNQFSDKIDLVLIPKEGDAATIVDIKDFKENLHVFPITKTKMDRSPVSEIIEEC